MGQMYARHFRDSLTSSDGVEHAVVPEVLQLLFNQQCSPVYAYAHS